MVSFVSNDERPSDRETNQKIASSIRLAFFEHAERGTACLACIAIDARGGDDDARATCGCLGGMLMLCLWFVCLYTCFAFFDVSENSIFLIFF
jgi:hypothetical protein